MKKIEAGEPLTQSAEVLAENVAQLKTLFPEAVTEGKIDLDVLKQLLGGAVDEREEKYGLNWHGKRKARQLALMPSTGTLRPCPEESVDWDTTQNLMIEGDNLEVLKLLQKSYAGKVKLIYIDPPYNTGKDFVYPDDFRDNIKNYLELTGQVEGGRKISSNTEASGRFHTDWLNMMYPRLKLAKTLLRTNGVILISIDDSEVDNLRKVCDEIFGAENFCAQLAIINNLKGRNSQKNVATCHEYLVAYSKTQEGFLYGLPLTPEQRAEYKYKDDRDEPYALRDLRKRGGPDRREDRPNMYFPIFFNTKTAACSLDRTTPDEIEIYPKKGDGSDGRWRWGKEKVAQNLHILHPRQSDRRDRWDVDHRVYLRPTAAIALEDDSEDDDDQDDAAERSAKSKSFWSGPEISSDAGKRAYKEIMPDFPYDFPKAVDFMRRCLAIGSGPKDLVLDFFAGSGTTAQAVYQSNSDELLDRKFIMVQLPEPVAHKRFNTLAEVTKERARRSARAIRDQNPLFQGDLGFRVFKLDTSNVHAWEPNRDNIAQTLEHAAEHLRADRTEQDILFELLIKLGLDLTVPIEAKDIAGKSVHSIGAGVLMACLDKKISTKEVEPLAHGIADWHKRLGPAGEPTIVFRDSAFSDDVAKTNLAAILQQHGLENVRSL